jgi:glycosyltransferase involved in cell wall biosynthesis
MGLNAVFLTGVYFTPQRLPYSLVYVLPTRLRARALAQLGKRRFEALPDERIMSVSGFLPESLLRPLNMIRTWNFIHDWYASRWIRKHSKNENHGSIFHGFQGSCGRSLAIARQLGMISAVEITQPLGTFSVLAEETAKLGLPLGRSKAHLEDNHEIKIADFAIVQSEWSITGIRELRPDAKIILLPLGTDTERFSPSRKRAPQFRVIFVGQICIRKGVHHLLEAWRRVMLPNAELLMVGAPTDEIGYRLVQEHVPGVRWMGQVSSPKQLAQLYRESDVFVGPSLSEGGFNAVYEAGASGLPCIVSDRAGSFVRNGIEGFVLRVGDVTGLRERLSALYQNTDMRHRMGAAARHRAEEYSWERFGERLVRAYEYMAATVSDPQTALDFFEA